MGRSATETHLASMCERKEVEGFCWSVPSGPHLDGLNR